MKGTAQMKLLASLLVSILLLQACAGSVAKKPAEARTIAPNTGASVAQSADQEQAETPKRRIWPWAVGGAALGIAAAGVLIGLVVYSLSHMFDDADFSGLGGGNSGSNGRSPLPVVASR